MQGQSGTKVRGIVHGGDWDIVIQPRRAFANLEASTLWRYRDLIWMFFVRDFVAFYKQTILGPIWYLIQPTLTAITYFVIFGKIANLSTDGLPPFIFYMSGIVLWSYFSACLTNNAEVFSKNSQLFGKVYFPRLVVPISVALSSMVALFMQFSLLLIIVAGFQIAGNPIRVAWSNLVLLPLLVVYVACAGLSVGLLISALTVRFRDLAFAVGFIAQLWMLATPLVYPFSQIPEHYRGYFHFNPMTAPIESLRSLLFGTPGVESGLWLSNLAIVLVLMVAGLVLFTRAETNAMDTV